MGSGSLCIAAALLAGATASCGARANDPAPLGARPRAAAQSQAPRKAETVPETATRNGKAVRLNIPDRKQAPGRPASGWCGETAIQEALLFHGAFFPQKAINKAGNPRHPDLYARDIPVALKNLRADVAYWRAGRCEFSKFLAWMQQQITKGHPVLTGVKINPTRHPSWGLDHFVLAVGFDDKSLTLNTTWGKQETLARKQLLSTQKGLSFKNRYNSYYGICIRGLARAPSGPAVRLFVVRETQDKMEVVVKCERLTPGSGYEVHRSASHAKEPPGPLAAFTAKGSTHAFRDTIDKKRPAIYRCRRAKRRALPRD